VQSEPITLKPVDLASDGPAIFRAWGHDPLNFLYLTARAFSNVDDASRYLANLFQSGESRAFHVIHASSDIIGIVKVNLMGHRSTIGYVIHRPFCGNGFATMAVMQATAMIEEMPQIARIWATCALENRASARVLEKCGFEHEGILRNWVIYPAQGERPFDNHSYVKIPARVR
jgi:ribosomal-protein-alanine N-acetyltransferase